MFQNIINKLLSKIKIIRLAKILKIDPEFFFSFILIHFSKLIRGKVDDKLIVLGGAKGKAFVGNTKYLYYYLKENTDYNLIYITKDLLLKKELEQMGVNTIYAYSLGAIKVLRKARFIFVTHGVADIIPIKFSPRTTFIQTWHGQDIKIVNLYIDKSFRYSKLAKILGVKLRNDQVYDLFLTTSGEKKPREIIAKSMKLPQRRIISTGYPRNDIFFSKDPNLLKSIKEKYSIPQNYERIILYAPTFREKFSSKEPFQREDLIELNKYCKSTNTLFLIKAHINEKIINIETLSNVRSVKKEADIQELLFISDILISDYSSVYCDYLLLNRPVILYTYDYDEYINKRGIYYDHLEEISPGPLVYSSKELLYTIKNIKEIQNQYKSKYVKVRDYFNKYLDGKSSERLLRYLKIIK
ncbi:MAG: CDP-glycerol glycerophosphotransferase family protein [Promethearchaeota archaeon]